MKQFIAVFVLLALLAGKATAQAPCAAFTATATTCPGVFADIHVNITLNGWAGSGNVLNCVEIVNLTGTVLCNTCTTQSAVTCGYLNINSPVSYTWALANDQLVYGSYRLVLHYTTALGSTSCITPQFSIQTINAGEHFTLQLLDTSGSLATFAIGQNVTDFNVCDKITLSIGTPMFQAPQTVRIYQVDQNGNQVMGGYDRTVIRYPYSPLSPKESLVQIMPFLVAPNNYELGQPLPRSANSRVLLWFRAELWVCGLRQQQSTFSYNNICVERTPPLIIKLPR